jgi:hypothetical protein
LQISCYAQRLSDKPGEYYFFFEVTEANCPKSNSSLESLLNKMEVELKDVLQVDLTPQDACSITPWLLTTQWHEHVERYDTAELKALVALPKEELPGLRELVLAYMERATELISATSLITLQCLNTPDPEKG